MKEQQKKREKRSRLSPIIEPIKRNKAASVVYFTLRILTVGVLIRSIFLGQWESVFTCFLTLLLFTLPHFVEKSFRIDLPTTLEIIAFMFIFCAEILGEIECYYIKYPLWDTMLHTTSGFVFAAFGFCLLDMLNRNKKLSLNLSPLSLSLVAFCFSMTVGVLWEFFEFGADCFFRFDMQKDTLLSGLSTVTLDPKSSNTAVLLDGVIRTVIEHADGTVTVIEGGYLDIGIYDTMKDLFVNFIGAVVFSFIGYFYVKHRGKGKIARQFIPVVQKEEPREDENDSEDAKDKAPV
jgi:hypothetical protein